MTIPLIPGLSGEGVLIPAEARRCAADCGEHRQAAGVVAPISARCPTPSRRRPSSGSSSPPRGSPQSPERYTAAIMIGLRLCGLFIPVRFTGRNVERVALRHVKLDQLIAFSSRVSCRRLRRRQCRYFRRARRAGRCETSSVSRDPLLSHPITGSGVCCACTASGHAAAAPPINEMNSRRLIRSPRRR